MLANVHEANKVRLGDYLASEKYDGIRAFWNGDELLTRTGRRISAPDWFVANWPSTMMDGELWIARGRFEDVLATVRDHMPNEAAWRSVRYMVFDLPSHAGVFSERLRALESELAHSDATTIELVRHWQIEDEESLARELSSIVAAGGEGLVLHKASSLYIPGRSDDLLKVKPYRDAEACITAHVPGTGKYRNMLGAIEVRTPEGAVFRIGTGFSDEQRKHPPDVGTCVTYRYDGFTENGVPRFARFLRVLPVETVVQPANDTQRNKPR